MPSPSKPDKQDRPNQRANTRRVLLCVTGLSPQVVTETLYALAVQQAEPWVPSEIHIITTAEGAERARLLLLSEDPGWLRKLQDEYRLGEISLNADTIHVLTDDTGQPLIDLRTPQDNERAADLITERVRQLTADPDCELHVSIAGGRKTMGYYLGYALSLFGREQDRLSHVLVSPPYESHPDFFYPSRKERIIYSLDNRQRPLDCRAAEVTLATIPFVRLRHGLDKRLLQGQSRFSEAVASAQQSLQPPRLQLNAASREITAGDKTIKLQPAQFALYQLFARRAKQGLPPLPAPNKEVPDKQWAERFLREYRALHHAMDDIDNTQKVLAHGMDGGYFSTLKSKLHKKINKALGPAAQPYLIDDGGTRPRRYALKLPPEAIAFAEETPQPNTPSKQTPIQRDKT